MKTIDFKNKDIEILNKMIFDSSILLEDIENIVLQDDNTITLNIERRTFEDVERKRFFLFWERTYFQGKSSQLKFHNVRRINKTKEKKEPQMSNDFILEIKSNSERPELKIKTVHHNDILIIEFKSEIQISLVDLKDSDFGKGICVGNVGYTNREWKALLEGYEKLMHE